MTRLFPIVVLAACSSEEGLTGVDDDTDAGTDAPLVGCFQDAPAADRQRLAIASQPFDGPGQNADRYAVMTVSDDGSLTPTDTTFDMRRAFSGRIHFSPSGELGIAVQEDGTLGVFRVSADASITVVDPAFGDDDFYASDIVWDLANERIWVVDENWRNNGGGLYTVNVDCTTGALSAPSLQIPSKRARALMPLGDELAVVVAVDVADSAEGNDVHVVDLASATTIAGAAVLDDEAIVSRGAVVAGEWVLFGDNAGFSSVPNRIGVARWDGTVLSPVQTLTPFEDPYDIVASPWGNAAIAVSGFGDEIVPLRLDGSSWSAGSPIGAPLPGAAVVLQAGALRGHVYVAENTGIHHVQFNEDGTVTDLGAASFGSDVTDVVGTIGIQP